MTDPATRPATDPRRGPLVAVLASTPHAGHRLYEQRLTAELARDGEVLYVEPPTAVWSRRRGFARRSPRCPEPGVLLATPWTVPGSRRAVLHRLNTLAATGALLAGSLRAGRRPSAVVAAQDVDAILAGVVHRVLRARLVVLVKDDYVAGAELLGVPRRRLEQARDESFRHADDVVVVSPVLRDLCARLGREAHVVPAGADVRPAPPVGAPRRGGAVFLGMVSDRIDFDALCAVAATGCRLTVVGQVQGTFSRRAEWEHLTARGNVEWTGHLPAEEVAARLADASVGLLPYTLSEFNQASFPLKVLEYLAAGLPVVSTRLAAVQWLGAPGVVVADDPAGFARAAARLQQEAEGLGEEEGRERRREFARAHTWQRRGEQWRALLLGSVQRGAEPARPPARSPA